MGMTIEMPIEIKEIIDSILKIADEKPPFCTESDKINAIGVIRLIESATTRWSILHGGNEKSLEAYLVSRLGLENIMQYRKLRTTAYMILLS